MTTFQDPPAQSRRAARQSERGDTADFLATAGSAPAPAGYPGYSVPPVVQAQAAPLPPAAPTSGRRSRGAAEVRGLVDMPTEPPPGIQPSSGEPLNYATQGAPQQYIAPVQHSAPTYPAQQQPAAAGEQPAFRVRDFSPEGRRSGVQASAASVAQPVALDYQTQAAPPQFVAPPQYAAPQYAAPQNAAPQYAEPQYVAPQYIAPVQAAPPQPAPVQFAVPPQPAPVAAPAPVEHTLTRRELRAIQWEQESATPQSFAGGVPPLVEPATATGAATATALSNAMAEFESLTRAAQSKAQAPAPVAYPQAEAAPAEFAPAPYYGAAQPSPVEAAPAPFAGFPPAEPNLSQAAAPVISHVPQFVEPERREQSYAASTGHWSRQAELDDETQPYENTLSRDVGRGNVSTATNALVLPTDSQLNDFSSILTSTGEILVTGSISLPKSVSSTGGDSRRYDDPDVDNLFDAYDNEIVATDSAPVRAIRAVSTHTSTRGVIHANKPHGNRMLTVLLISAAVMAVGVVALLVAGFVFDIF